MGRRYRHWQALSSEKPGAYKDLSRLLLENRRFSPLEQLTYGDHGLTQAIETVDKAIRENRRIALYADYDVDGTMSCVSWIWFFRAIGFANFVHYIPCRFNEGYGLNLEAVKHLIDNEGAELVITMDTGITANAEAAYCRQHGVEFICTDHHTIQPDKMPDCVILNPKMHPDDLYKELCGCGITFVLLRKLGERFEIDPVIWLDLLALTGMATICDVVPLNGVNHKLAKMGVNALSKSRRPVLRRLMEACQAPDADEKDIGFRLGPRINAVGRLEHADIVIQAFAGEDPEPLIHYMGECNERRKQIQKVIVEEARELARRFPDDPVLFLGGDWHPGVVGIAASKIAEEFWRPVWLFQKKDGLCRGSARSIKGFDVTAAMTAAAGLFLKFGGHQAAGGFTFELAREDELRDALIRHAATIRAAKPDLWESVISYDCELSTDLATLALLDELDQMKPFGHGFEEPRFRIRAEIARVDFLNDRMTGKPKHTAVHIRGRYGLPQKIMFFNEVHVELQGAAEASFVVAAARNTFRGKTSLALYGADFEL